MIFEPEHIERLRQGPRTWNEWRAENPRIAPNLAGITLGIGDRQMGPINGGPINLGYARLVQACLRFATLTGANLRGAELTGADLRDARLDGADLTGADLSGAVLERADLSGACLEGANLCGANLTEIRNLTAAQLYEAEGDARTILPEPFERPLIWTAAASPPPMSPPPMRAVRSVPVAMPFSPPEPADGPEIEEEAAANKHVTWLVGGPRRAGR